MNIKNLFGRMTKRIHASARFGAAMTAALIAVLVVLNTVLFGLANHFSWYFRTTEKLEHTISGATDAYLGEVASAGAVRIRFCENTENLETDEVYNLVYQTALQLAGRYGFITVDNINIFINPDEVEPYKYETDPETGAYVTDAETGKRVQKYAVSRTSVIIDGVGDYVVLPMQSFFVLDENQEITAYNGEEIFASMIHRVQTETRPTAYFTTSHGETYAPAFYNRLLCAGYMTQTVDLMTEEMTPAAGDILVISSPQYDFIRGNTDKGIRGEIEKVEEFLAAGGSVYAMLDPLITNTVYLEALLSDWGLTVDRATGENGVRNAVMIQDSVNSVTTDGYALITSSPKDGMGGEIAAAMEETGAGRVIISRVSPLTLTGKTGKTVSSILTSSGTSRAYSDGRETNADGNYTVAAASVDTASGGGVFLVASVYLTAQDAMTTNEYGNRDLIFGLVHALSGASVPTGCTYLLFSATTLEDLTMREARWWTALLAVILPAAVAVTGVVMIRKRRTR